MRRLVVSVLMGFGLVVIGSGAASAEPVPGASAAQAVAGKKMCKVTDPKLDELSGIVATDDGFVVINDGSPLDSHKRIFFLDAKCKIVKNVPFSAGPRDTEDLILSADGKTLWIADIGDNQKERPTIGLWSMPANGSQKPKIHRLSYPAEGKHDAEALLLNGDGTPIIITKEAGAPAQLYTPAAALETDNAEGVPLKKVGEITVPASDTPANTLSRLLRGSIDGGAVAQGGSKVVLRTYTDALEWDVTGGDVLGALKGAPRVTPLPNEQLGEAITYSPDGKYFYTVSDMQGKPDEADNFILRYSPVPKVSTAKAAAAGGSGGDSGASWFSNLSINDITYAVGGVGVLGAILVGFGIFGIMRARKRPPLEPAAQSGGGLNPTDPETELLAVGGAAAGRGGPGVYGGNRPGGPAVYGAQSGPPAKGSGVYGGRPGPAGQPARPGPGQGGQPARPGPGGQPARPAQGGQPPRPGQGGPGQGGQPARPGQGGQPPRPGQGGQPARRPGGAQPQPAGRPPQGGQPSGRPPQGGQPSGRPPQGGQPSGRPPQGGQPGGGRPGPGGGGGSVYGAPPASSPLPPPQPPQGPQRGGSGRRPSGFFGQGSGRPDDGRQASNDMNNYADSRGRGRDYDNPGYGRR